MTPTTPNATGLLGTAVTAHPLLEPADHSQYLLHNKNEILFVLRSMLASADNITIHFNDGRDFLLSALIAVDDTGITLDYGSNPEMNQRALAADRLFCVTSHEKIRIQFLLHGIRQIQDNGRPAFRAALPDTVLRLQRREYFRLTAPIARPIKCRIPAGADNKTVPAATEANVIDISGGGLAVVVPPAGLAFNTGDVFSSCRIELPDVGIIVATLQVRNIFEVTLRSGAQVTRAGCQFSNLPGPMLTLVQRYIIKVERERKAREAGVT